MMARPKRVAHVVINVTDLERARRFYCEGLGMSETSASAAASATLPCS